MRDRRDALGPTKPPSSCLLAPRMKEIIHVQNLILHNKLGDSVDSKASFFENGRSTLYPRVLIVDKKSNSDPHPDKVGRPNLMIDEGEFGSLSASNVLEGDSETDAVDHGTWGGSIAQHREQPILKSVYHDQLDSEQQSEEYPTDIRYWSDYSRVYFHPRSLHKIPDTSGSDHWDWQESHQMFLRFNEEVELIDGPFRLLAEDCDNMQGIQVLNDTTTFGSFTKSFLTCFRDEYSKLPSLTFSMLTLGFQDIIAPVNDEESRAVLNEALYFRNLDELSSMNIPVQEPPLWPNFVWNNPLYWPSENIYHQSALLSSHVESSTLPFRLLHALGHRDMASTFGHLKRDNNSSFGGLSGAFPLESEFNGEAIVNFSACGIESPEARTDVIRGFSKKMTEAYMQWSSKNLSTRMRCTDSIHAPAFPLPSSFPPFAHTEESQQRANTLHSTPTFSSLSSTSTTTARRFQRYATLVDTCIKRKPYLSLSMGFSIDETRELANDLWGICDNLGNTNSA